MIYFFKETIKFKKFIFLQFFFKILKIKKKAQIFDINLIF